MKNIKYILLILTVFFFSACEEVVDVDLNTAPPRLVVDASINWVKGTDGSQQTIKLTMTGSYLKIQFLRYRVLQYLLQTALIQYLTLLKLPVRANMYVLTLYL